MIPPPGQPTTRAGLGAGTDQTGETVGLVKPHTRRREIAAFRQALLDQHPTESVYGSWDNATTQADDAVEAVGRSAAGRLVVLSLPTDRPWRQPIEMRWRPLRRRVPQEALFARVNTLVAAAQDFLTRHHRYPARILSIMGAIPKNLSVCT